MPLFLPNPVLKLLTSVKSPAPRMPWPPNPVPELDSFSVSLLKQLVFMISWSDHCQRDKNLGQEPFPGEYPKNCRDSTKLQLLFPMSWTALFLGTEPFMNSIQQKEPSPTLHQNILHVVMASDVKWEQGNQSFTSKRSLTSQMVLS